MSYLEILKQAQQQAHQLIWGEEALNHQNTQDLTSVDLNKNLYNTIENQSGDKLDTSDDKIEEIIIPLDNKNKKEINLAAQIIINSTNAIELSKKLRGGSNSAKRLAKNIISGKIDHLQLQKAINIIEKTKLNHIDAKLVGGDAMKQLSNYLHLGLNLNVALKMKYIEKEMK
jgi:hypothetical protein